MITRIARVERENKRRLYRVSTNIPVLIIPVFPKNETNKKDKEPPKFDSCLLDISGCGGLFVLPENFPEVSQIIAKFKLNEFDAEIICDVVRRSEENNTIATAFNYPCNAPSNIANPMKWLEDKITHFVFSKQVVWKKDEETIKKARKYLTKIRLEDKY